jgi:NADP-dependent 3-hydroxy acid dehydrogenase YdfG
MEEVIVITGADNGIGFHMAKALLEEGYRLAALDLYDRNLVSLSSEDPEQLSVFRCDVTDPAEVDATIAAIVKRWGRIDVLVNNACLALFEPFETKSLAETRREFEVNYYGYIHTIEAVLPQMKAQGRGIIHNVSSGVGVTGFPGIYGYASTKGGDRIPDPHPGAGVRALWHQRQFDPSAPDQYHLGLTLGHPRPGDGRSRRGRT